VCCSASSTSTRSARRILERIDHPFIVSLRFAFQTEHKLYMVFGALLLLVLLLLLLLLLL
jgi:hypothetical protein